MTNKTYQFNIGVDIAKHKLDVSFSDQRVVSFENNLALPSVAQNGRLAYPLLGEVTDRDMRGRKSHGRPVY